MGFSEISWDKMDFSNDRRRSELDSPGHTDDMSPFCRTPFPEQRPRFRWSTPANGASEERGETVSQNISFSPGYDSYSTSLSYDSGFGDSTVHSSPNYGSTVLFKSPAELGDKRTNSCSRFIADDLSAYQAPELPCTHWLWRVVKILLFGLTVASVAVICIWCLRKSPTFNDLVVKQDNKIYI